MKNISRNIRVLIASTLMLGLCMAAAPNDASAARDCRALSVGGYPQGITVNGTTATGTFKVPAGCPAQEVSLTSFKKHQSTLPLSAQQYFSHSTASYGPGTHTISTSVPGEDCFYQVDLFRGGPQMQLQDIDYTPILMAYKFGGGRDCLVTPPATPPATSTPAPEAPAAAPSELPETGAGSVIATFIGVSAISSIVYHIAVRRFGLSL